MAEVKFVALLQHLGQSGPQRALIVGAIIGRMAAPGAERATHRWLGERRALGELLEFDFATLPLAPFYRAADLLMRHPAGRLPVRDWLANDDAILAWIFPAGLCAADEQHLRAELHTPHHYERPDGGHGQPWSPPAAGEAAPSDWPETEPTRDASLAAAERDLPAVLDELFPAGADPEPD